MIRRALSALALTGVLIQVASAQTTPALARLQTKAESSGFTSTSTHAEVVAFVKAVDQASPLVHYVAFGKSGEGRELPMAVVGTGLKDGSAASVLSTGKLRVHIQGNIHAGEVEGKESAQILLRELALGQHAAWLDSMVLLITPIYNADGNEKFALTNRGSQNGPINGMGTRATAQNINLNRDYTKLEAPESRAFAKLWNDYDPHVGMDLHTSNGSAHAYHLTYSPPLHPATSDAIMNVMKGEWFPFITSQIKQKRGWDTFYYGNAGRLGGAGRGGRGGAPEAGRGEGAGRGAAQPNAAGAVPQGQAPRAWATFEHVPRFHNNYVGIRNRFALLSEAYSYATFQDRILATNYFIEEAMNFAHQHADRLKQIVAAADAETLVGRNLATRAAQTTGGIIDVLMGEVQEITNPNNGARMNQRVDVSRVEPMFDRLWFAPTWLEEVPAEFYVPAAATKSLDVLRAHGIVLREVTTPVAGVEEFVITSNTAQPVRPNSIDTQNHELRRLEGYWRPATTPVPAGSYAVAMNQRLARLAFLMLAPTSDDGLVNWNFLDDMLKGATYPIARRR